jgi:hypothetical protein
MLPNLATTDRIPFMFHVSTLMLSCAARSSTTWCAAAAVAAGAAAPAPGAYSPPSTGAFSSKANSFKSSDTRRVLERSFLLTLSLTAAC